MENIFLSSKFNILSKKLNSSENDFPNLIIKTDSVLEKYEQVVPANCRNLMNDPKFYWIERYNNFLWFLVYFDEEKTYKIIRINSKTGHCDTINTDFLTYPEDFFILNFSLILLILQTSLYPLVMKYMKLIIIVFPGLK